MVVVVSLLFFAGLVHRQRSLSAVTFCPSAEKSIEKKGAAAGAASFSTEGLGVRFIVSIDLEVHECNEVPLSMVCVSRRFFIPEQPSTTVLYGAAASEALV